MTKAELLKLLRGVPADAEVLVSVPGEVRSLAALEPFEVEYGPVACIVCRDNSEVPTGEMQAIDQLLSIIEQQYRSLPPSRGNSFAEWMIALQRPAMLTYPPPRGNPTTESRRLDWIIWRKAMIKTAALALAAALVSEQEIKKLRGDR